jgi:hypothetical protein
MDLAEPGPLLFVGSVLLLALYRSSLPPSPSSSQLSSSHLPKSIENQQPQSAASVWFGAQAMDRLRSKARYDISPLADRALFVQWCRRTNDRLKNDEEYKLKTRQRNLRSEHKEKLSELQQRLEDSISIWKSHPSYQRSHSLAREIEGKEKAVRNMEKLLEIDPATVKKNEQEKILRTQAAFKKNQSELAAMKTELGLLHAVAEHREMEACAEELHSFKSSIGLVEVKAALSATQRERGGKRGASGKSFEDEATDAVLV